jgi:hypothetical protein
LVESVGGKESFFLGINRTVNSDVFEVITKRRPTGVEDEVLISPAGMIIPFALVVVSDTVVDAVLTIAGEAAESFVICWLLAYYP